MSSVLDRWPYSRRSLWIVLGAVAAVVVAAVVLVVVLNGRDGSTPTATSSSGQPDELPPPTPIPVETVTPGPSPSASMTVAEIGDTPVVADPDGKAVDAGVTVQLVSLRPIQTQAYERGDSSGPGLAVTVVVTNNTDGELDLTADMNLYTGTGQPGVSNTLDGHNSPFGKDKLAPGESAERTAVFGAPNATGTPVTVQVVMDKTYTLQATVGS